MNKSKLFGGIVLLLIAAVLLVANLTLEPDKLMFQIGDQNMPWVPVVALAIIGVFMLATASQQEGVFMVEESKVELKEDPARAALNKRMETMAWGAFLIMLGGFALVPHSTIPKGWWSVGVGLIMLGLNLARYLNQMRMSGFTTFVGLLSVLGGIAQLTGWSSLEGAFFFIILGGYLILKPYFDKRQLFGKAEHV